MATETLYATSLISGSVSTSANALGAPDGVFTTDTGTTNWTARFAMGDPTGTSANGTHTITVRVRKQPGQSGTPTVDSITVFDANGTVATYSTVTNVTSTTSQDISFTFASSSITAAPSTLEVQVATTGAGGNPSTRAPVQLDSITWSGDFIAPTPKSASDTLSVSISDSGNAAPYTPPSTNITFVGKNEIATTTGSLACPAPTGLTSGDFEIAIMIACTQASTAGAAPTGWAALYDVGSSDGSGDSSRLALYYKTDRTQTGTVTFTHSSARAGQVTRLAYRNVDTTTPIEARADTTGYDANNTTSHTIPSVTAVSNGALVVAYAVADGSVKTVPHWTFESGWTERQDNTDNTVGGDSTALGAADKPVNAGATGTATVMNADADYAMVGALVLKPSSTGGGTPKSGSDTNTVSITETNTLASSSSRTDTPTLTLTENKAIAASSSRSDTLSMTLTDTSNVSVVLSGTDTLSIGVSETADASVNAAVSASDISTVQVAETIVLAAQSARTDALSVGLADASTLDVAQPVSDSVDIGLSETTDVNVTQPASDSAGIGVDESSNVSVSIDGTETTSVSLAELTQIVVTLSSTDTLSTSISESTSSGGTANKNTTDTLSIGLSENVTNGVVVNVSDTAVIGMSETPTTAVFLSSADQAVIGLVETAQLGAALQALDSLVIALTEGVTTGAGIETVDSLSVSLSETTQILTDAATYNVSTWNGTQWVNAELFVWDGTAWVYAEAAVWDGVQWQ